MERATCPSCKNVNVPAGHVCIDCYIRTPQDRQDAWERADAARQQHVESLRDKFAMSVLPTVILGSERGGNEEHGTAFVGPVSPDSFYTDRAYAWADLMLESRKKPLPESG